MLQEAFGTNNLIPARDLTYHEQIKCLEEWRESRNQDAYKRLLGSLIRIAYQEARRFCSNVHWANYDEVLYDVCIPTIERCINGFDLDKAAGKNPLANYVFRSVRSALGTFSRKGKFKLQGHSDSLDEVFDDDDDRTLGDFLSAKVLSPEDEVMVDDLRLKTAAWCRAVIATCLSGRQRQVAECFYLSDEVPSIDAVAVTLGTTYHTIQYDLRTIKAILRSTLEYDDEGEALPVSSCRYLLGHFVPGIALTQPSDEEEHLEKFTRAGVIFTSGGKIDLSHAGNHSFNITIFRMQNGTFKSGLALLEEHKAASVFEFFQRDDIDTNLFILPDKKVDLLKKQRFGKEENYRDKTDYDLTPAEIASAVRMAPNLQKMMDLFDLKIDNGKWVVSASSKVFRKEWCMVNGGSAKKTGKKLLKMCGIEGQDQKALQAFFELVFGIDLIFNIQASHPVAAKECLDPAYLLDQLRSPANVSILYACGIEVKGDQCLVKTNTEDFRPTPLNVGKSTLTAITIFQILSLPMNHPGILDFCRMVFPDKKVVSGKSRNGVVMNEMKPEELITELQKEENRTILRVKASRDDADILYVDMDFYDFRGVQFNVKGRSVGITVICRCLGLYPSKTDIAMIYKMVFGEDRIITKQMKAN